MKKHPLLRTALLVMTAAALLCVSALAVEDGAPANSMYGTFWATGAPRHRHHSGPYHQGGVQFSVHRRHGRRSVLSGFSPIGALNMIVNDGLVAAIKDNAGIFLFLVLLGIIVALVNAPAAPLPSAAGHQKTLRPRWGLPSPPSCWAF